MNFMNDLIGFVILFIHLKEYTALYLNRFLFHVTVDVTI